MSLSQGGAAAKLTAYCAIFASLGVSNCVEKSASAMEIR
jgi:hypothetical protein